LLVEDEESVRVLTRTILTACGYSVLEAANGEEALQLVRKQEGHLDLIVTDVVMPGLGGRNLVEKLRATYPNAKVLYLSGYTGDVILRHGILHDEVPFLQKPFTPDALATKVRAVLDPV
jgi:CheY-like chemotaxis protein